MPPEAIERLRRTIHEGKRVSFWWTMGVNQSHQGVRTAQAIINLALMTGNIGRPGTGANSITGQCNAMGSRLFSNTTNLLGGHDFANPTHRRKVADVLEHRRGAHSARSELALPPHHGRHSPRRDSRAVGRRHQPGPLVDQSGACPRHARPARLPRRAGHVSHDRDGAAGRPRAARRRLGREGRNVHQLRTPHRRDQESGRAPGEALADFSHLPADRRILGLRRNVSRWEFARGGVSKSSSNSAPASRATSPASTTTVMLDAAGGIQWPYPTERDAEFATTPSQRRLFADGRFYHPDGNAKFLCEAPRPLPEEPNTKFPFMLLTGRGSVAQWHTQTRTAKSAVLRKLYPRNPYVEINPPTPANFRFAPATRSRSPRSAGTSRPRPCSPPRAAGPAFHSHALRCDE